MIRAVAGRPVAMPVQPVLARQQSIHGIQQVIVGPGAHLDDDETRCRVRDEDRQQPVIGFDVGKEGGACRRQVRDTSRRAGPNRQVARLYGKMLRSASRIRPRPPIAGADS